MDENEKTYYIEVNNSKAYFQYDERTQTYSRGGKKVTIGKEKINDFINTAKVLGFKAGEL